MWQDNQTMKAIAFITFFFLPMATVAVSTIAPPYSPTSHLRSSYMRLSLQTQSYLIR